MTHTALTALLSHWRRRPGQALVLVLGLALATALWSAVQALNAEARARYAQAAETLEGAARPLLTRPGAPFTLAEFAALRRAGWPVTPVLEGQLQTPTGPVPLVGVDFVSRSGAEGLQGDSAPDAPTPAELLLAPGRLLARADLAARLQGDEFKGAEFQGDGLPPVILSQTAPAGMILTDISTAERLLNRPGQIDRMELTGPRPNAAPMPEGAQLLDPDRPDTAALTDSFHLNLTAFGLLAFAVGLFVVHGIAGLAFEQRRATFRTLRALGVPGPLLTRLVLGELIALALIAGLIGVALGYVVAAALLPDVSASLRGLYGAQVGTDLQLRPGWVLGAMAMALAGALTAGAQGLLRLRRMPILAASGSGQWAARAQRQMRVIAGCGALCLLAGALALLPGGLLAGFVAMGGAMLGAALILPAALALILTALARRARGPVAQWVWSDMSMQLPGLSLALMALLLALATNIGVGTMVSSFRLTFTGWLDQRLAAELYVTARDQAQADRMQAWLAPRVEAILPIRHAQTQIEGRSGRVYGIVDHATYRDNWPLIAAMPAPWDALNAGAVLINEQLARRQDLWPGDRVDLGGTWQAQIAGVYSDYGNPHPQAIAALPDLLRHHPDIPDTRFGLRLAPDDVPALNADLRAAFDLPADAVVDQAAVKALSLRIFERTFLITAALNLLTLGVAAFAILTSLLALWSARLPQLAPAWALGLSRRRLAGLELLRSLALSGLVAVLALPLGLGLAWLLLAVVNVQAFGWRLPMHLFPLDWLRLLALALLAGGLAALWPARRLLRMAPARLLQVFAHES